MNALTYATLLFLHVTSAAFWVGGMAAMHFAARPAAVDTLAPPQRLPFMAAALGRFFRGVDIALTLLWASGLAMFATLGGFAGSHWRVHAMLTLALVMTGVYVWLRARGLPALRRAAAAAQWPEAGERLGTIRRLVAANLALGTVVFAVALVGRAG